MTYYTKVELVLRLLPTIYAAHCAQALDERLRGAGIRHPITVAVRPDARAVVIDAEALADAVLRVLNDTDDDRQTGSPIGEEEETEGQAAAEE